MADYASALRAAIVANRAPTAAVAQDDIGVNYATTVPSPSAGHPSSGATHDATLVTRPAAYPPAGATRGEPLLITTPGIVSTGATPSVSANPVNGGDHPQPRHSYPPYAPSPVRRSRRGRILGCVRPLGTPPPVDDRPSRPPPPPYFDAATMENWAHDQTWTQPDDHRRRGRAPPARGPSPSPSPPAMPLIPIWGGPLPWARPLASLPVWVPYLVAPCPLPMSQWLEPPPPAAGLTPIRYPNESLQGWLTPQPANMSRSAYWAAALLGVNAGRPPCSYHTTASLMHAQANYVRVYRTMAQPHYGPLRPQHRL